MLTLRKFMGLLLVCGAAALITAAPGCTTTQPDGSTVQVSAAAQAKVAVSVGVSAVTGVRTIADRLLLSKVINAAEAQRIQNQCNEARTYLDAARALLASGSALDLSTAQGKLMAAQALLASANDFFTAKGYKS